METPRLSKLLFLLVVGALGSASAQTADFYDEIARIDAALKDGDSGVLLQSRQSCLTQRRNAIELYRMGMETRARRALRYCFRSLMIPETAPVEIVSAPTEDDLLAAAAAEYDAVMALEPDLANGLKVYRECAACHEPEGWGRTTGSIPQVAGQHRSVLVRQLADFRAGNRVSAIMAPYATVEVIGGPQAVADVTAYVATLEMSVANGLGEGEDLARGESLYATHCAACHGASGEGSAADATPRLQAQHYKYLLRQFEWISDGKRRKASARMRDALPVFEEDEIAAVLDYVSRLEPPQELRATPNWKNPDFR